MVCVWISHAARTPFTTCSLTPTPKGPFPSRGPARESRLLGRIGKVTTCANSKIWGLFGLEGEMTQCQIHEMTHQSTGSNVVILGIYKGNPTVKAEIFVHQKQISVTTLCTFMEHTLDRNVIVGITSIHWFIILGSYPACIIGIQLLLFLFVLFLGPIITSCVQLPSWSQLLQLSVHFPTGIPL